MNNTKNPYFPDEIWEILETHNMTEDNTKKLREYFMNPSYYDTNRRTIIFSTPSRTGTSAFRIELPLYAIALHYPEKFNLIYADNNLGPKHIQAADLIVAHRAGHLHDQLYNIVKVWPKTSKRQVVIHDVDDSEFNLPLSHPMRTIWIAAEKDKMSIRSLKESDLVTTTGFKLQQTFRNFNPNVYVFRNMFDWEQPQWKIERTWPAKKDKLVIGWVGLTSHFEDIKKMAPILKYIHDKYSNTEFILAGMALKDTEVTITVDANGNKKFDEKEVIDITKTYRYRVSELFKEFDKNRIQILDAVSLEKYGEFYSKIDIGLSYVEHNVFNACKSEIKSVEYMKYGAVSIYSKYGGYKDMYDALPTDLKEKTHLLAIDTENPTVWKSVLETVVINYDTHREIADEMKKYVEEKYDINKHIDERVSFYNDVIEKNVDKEVNKISKILVS